MEDELTQPATQLVVDPRRRGHQNSGLNDDDLTDIFCILHPASMAACLATAQIAEHAPEHTISTTGVELKLRGSNKAAHNGPDRADLAAKGVPSRDIALRFSADLKQPLYGFCFGRNHQRCDFVIGNTEGAKRISNVHFRIYINEQSGVIMLEDQSTNGTQVEDVMLRGKEKENGALFKHVLQQGSLITLIMTPPDEDIKFVVRIPQREGEYERAYEQNLQDYFVRLDLYRQQRGAKKVAPTGRADGDHVPGGGPPDLFAPVTRRAQSVVDPEVSRLVKEWRGGPKYNRVGNVGKGAFASVYLVATKFEGTLFAAKEVEKRRFMKNGILDQKVDMEMKIMRKIQHPHIVQYIEDIDWEDYLYLIMDYVPNGDLGQLISKRKRLDEFTVKAMASQLLSALKYLHNMGVTHRDVKPDNILIQSNDPIYVKLTDFGLSKMVEDTDETFLRTFCGTLLYCAPEVYTEYREYDSKGNRTLRGKDKRYAHAPRYGHAVDLWSLGGVLFYALCGNPPYPAKSGTSHQELLKSIMTKPLDIRPLQREGVSEDGINFVWSLLQVQPERRPTIDQLEASSWLADSSQIASIGEDEVDMIREPNNEAIEESTSQLSINAPDDFETEAVATEFTEVEHQFATVGQQEIANSFTGDSESSESFLFMRNPSANPRLFGEVNASALGSSGVIPEEYLNLPISDPVSQNGIDNPVSNTEFSSTSADTHIEQRGSSTAMDGVDFTQAPTYGSDITTRHDFDKSHEIDTTAAAPSLFGAESMVGQMAMDSPSPVTGDVVPDSMAASLRRPRDDATNGENAQPAPKRAKSSRAIDIPISKTVFWDEKNRSTWHNDYPDMMLSEYIEAKETAESHGEKFTHGGKIFEKVVGSFRKTPSAEPEERVRSKSEPTVEQGRQMMMKRDERKLEDSATTQLPTNRPGHPMSMLSLSSLQGIGQTRNPEGSRPTNGDATFKRPPPILAKFLAVADSVLPSLNLTITESFTSWGRSSANTMIFPDNLENRIPKFAFKLVLWKKGLTVTENQSMKADSTFWISTKATLGININGVIVKSHHPKQPDEPSKYWAEIRHGDEVTVWEKELKRHLFVKFRFECHFGASKTLRSPDTPVTVISNDELSKELDKYVLEVEQNLVATSEKKKKTEENEREEERATERDKENELHRLKPAPLPTA